MIAVLIVVAVAIVIVVVTVVMSLKKKGKHFGVANHRRSKDDLAESDQAAPPPGAQVCIICKMVYVCQHSLGCTVKFGSDERNVYIII